ncbi:MAG TPA: FmdB family zinc ribbon protein [Thermoanaerobaculia bacterium]|nr:FmdB family zinc ribbon protein [Thermoanaerobaculia bacterium]
MPLYEYECLKCGKKMEILQRLDEAPLAACPECEGEVKKLLSAPAFQFKGSGWYVTDYAGKKGGTESKPESKSEGGEQKSGESSKPAESKPASSGGSSGSE